MNDTPGNNCRIAELPNCRILSAASQFSSLSNLTARQFGTSAILMRPRFTWRLRSRSLALGERTLLMGVVNVTPDSFSDGGQFLDRDHAVARALELLDQGADLLDI